MLSIGLDIGSTTIKAIAINNRRQIIFTKYERHNAQVREKILSLLEEIHSSLHPSSCTLTLTGSIGLGIAERQGFSFIQEVVAATKYVRQEHPKANSLIDIGGEDAKIVFFKDGEASDLRMNGNCAGGTGSFIDQMAILLEISDK